MFKGSFVALITPFRDGRIDEKAFQEFVDWQIGEGTHGLVPCGTTGESATLSHAEHGRVIELCVAAARKRVPVIAGTGSNSTVEAISLARHAKEAGADGILVVNPYYNRPTQDGLYQHFKAIHDAVGIPIIIYNIPGRTGVDMSVATMARLAELPRIAGVKDATADLARPLRMREAVGAKFCQLSGEDHTALAFLAQGGVGCISVTANVAPRLCAELHEAWQRGDVQRAMTINHQLLPLHDAMFAESNPIPVKFAASLLGKCDPALRLPLTSATPETQEKLRAALHDLGMLH